MDDEVKRITKPENVMVMGRNKSVGWKYVDGEKYYAEKTLEHSRRPGAVPNPKNKSLNLKQFQYNAERLKEID